MWSNREGWWQVSDRLDHLFQVALHPPPPASQVSDPYTVVLKGKKLPMSLLTDATKTKPVRTPPSEPSTLSKPR